MFSRVTATSMLSLLLVLAANGLSGADGSPSVPNVKRIVFLGDSITYSGEYVATVEAALLLQKPERDYEIVDLGLPSETVSGLSEPGHAGGSFPRPNLHERLDRVLTKLKPELLIACYGMNDGIYYPFGNDRFAAFSNGIVKLRQKLDKAGAQIIHLTPPTFDPLPLKGKTLPAGLAEYRKPYEGYDAVLERYSEWLLAHRSEGWTVIDIHGPMKAYLQKMREQKPGFTLAGDGVHAGEEGHRVMAEQVLRAWHLPFPQISDHLRGLVRKRQRILSDAWLTETGHARPGMNRGLPLAQALQQAEVLKQPIRKEIQAQGTAPAK